MLTKHTHTHTHTHTLSFSAQEGPHTTHLQIQEACGVGVNSLEFLLSYDVHGGRGCVAPTWGISDVEVLSIL